MWSENYLKKLIAKTAIQFSESFEVDGPEMFAHACSVGLKGVVSKVRDSRYPSGRGDDRVKRTCQQRETLPIAGFALKADKFDGIYLGRRKGSDLVYAGKVDNGFDIIDGRAAGAPKPLIRTTQPYAKNIGHRGIGSSRHCSRKSSTAPNPPMWHPFFKSIREDL